MATKKDIFSMFHPTEEQIPVTAYLYEYKHHVLPGLNLGKPQFNEENLIKNVQNYYTCPPFRIHKPLPCSLAESMTPRKIKSNQVTELVRSKCRWYRKKKQLLQLMCRKKRELNAKSIRLKNHMNLPYGFVNLTDHLSKNPDKYFKGVYNWYYDNVIATFKLGDDLYLLHAGGKNLNNLYISSVENHDRFSFVPKIKQQLRIPFSKNGPIYDVITSNYGENIGIRQRDVCSYLIRGDNIGDLIKTGMLVKKKKYPFVAMDIEKNEFCTVDTNRVIKFWTTDTCQNSATISIPDKESFSDHFIRTKYLPNANAETCIAIDRMNIYFFDKRKKSEVPCLTWKTENYVEVCDTMSLLVPSTMNNYWYLGLTHSCLLFDIRVGFVQKWSHMLPQTPCTGCILNIDGRSRINFSDSANECLLLSTQSTNDVVAIHNNWSSSQISKSSFPISVPNKIDTLHESRMKGVCSHPEISNKFYSSLIGLCGYRNKNRKGIFSLSSSGVVFHQSVETENLDELIEEQIYLNRDKILYLEKWVQEILSVYANSKGHLSTTDVVSMAEIAYKSCYNLENPKWHFPEVENNSLRQLSKGNLESCIDLLSLSLLNDFELDDDFEWKHEENRFTSTRNCLGKVEQWLVQQSIIDVNKSQNQLDILEEQIEENYDDQSSIISLEEITSTSSE